MRYRIGFGYHVRQCTYKETPESTKAWTLFRKYAQSSPENERNFANTFRGEPGSSYFVDGAEKVVLENLLAQRPRGAPASPRPLPATEASRLEEEEAVQTMASLGAAGELDPGWTQGIFWADQERGLFLRAIAAWNNALVATDFYAMRHGTTAPFEEVVGMDRMSVEGRVRVLDRILTVNGVELQVRHHAAPHRCAAAHEQARPRTRACAVAGCHDTPCKSCRMPRRSWSNRTTMSRCMAWTASRRGRACSNKLRPERASVTSGWWLVCGSRAWTCD